MPKVTEKTKMAMIVELMWVMQAVEGMTIKIFDPMNCAAAAEVAILVRVEQSMYNI